MAYKGHGMWEVLEVLRRVHRGEKLRAIARTTGRTRKTIRRYLKAAEAGGLASGRTGARRGGGCEGPGAAASRCASPKPDPPRPARTEY